jgi:hypothetical protein
MASRNVNVKSFKKTAANEIKENMKKILRV